jgi:hypothetical protein
MLQMKYFHIYLDLENIENCFSKFCTSFQTSKQLDIELFLLIEVAHYILFTFFLKVSKTLDISRTEEQLRILRV